MTVLNSHPSPASIQIAHADFYSGKTFYNHASVPFTMHDFKDGDRVCINTSLATYSFDFLSSSMNKLKKTI